MSKERKFLAGFLAGICLVVISLVLLSLVATAAPTPPLEGLTDGPLPAPTAQLNPAYGTYLPIPIWPTPHVVTAITYTNGYRLPAYSIIDVTFSITHGAQGSGLVNTTTLYLQHSNDCILYADGNVIAQSNATTGTFIQQVPLFGMCSRVAFTVANANPFTVSLWGLAKRSQ